MISGSSEGLLDSFHIFGKIKLPNNNNTKKGQVNKIITIYGFQWLIPFFYIYFISLPDKVQNI